MTTLHQLITQLLPEHRIQRIDEMQRLVVLGDGTRVTVWQYRHAAHASTVVSALHILGAESAIPQLWGADREGRITGHPSVVVTTPRGTPLANLQGQLGQGQLHALGVQLGEILGRVHLHQLPGFGRLGQHDEAPSWRQYRQQALTASMATLQADGIATPAESDTIVLVITAALAHDDTSTAVLMCGDVDPASVWVERNGTTVRITALTAWSSASGGRPVAEHVRLLDRFSHPDWFSLRVGYGESYDALSNRPADQLREAVLLPERMLWQVRQASNASQRGDRTRAHTLYQMVLRWSQSLRAQDPVDSFNDYPHHEG